VRALAVDGRGTVWAVFAGTGQSGGHALYRIEAGRAEEMAGVFTSYRGRPQDDWTRAGRATYRETFAVEPLALFAEPGAGVMVSTRQGLLRVEGRSVRAFPPDDALRSPLSPGAIAGDARRLVVGYPGHIEIIEGRAARRQFFDDNTRRLFLERGQAAGPAPAGALLSRAGEVWLALPYAIMAGQSHGAVLRLIQKDPARAALPPETIIARVSGGAFFQDNPEVALSGQNLARRFAGGEVVKIPANVVSVSAVAKDPWDFGPAQLRFKLDERPWTEWSDKNLLITPDILDEGVHRVLAQSRDMDGNIDPTPAELRFAVVTRDVTVIQVRDGQFERVFPSQFLRYQKGEVGRVEIENTLPRPVEVDVKLSIEDLFESPASARATLGPNEKRWLSLPGPFTARLLENRAQRTAQAVVEIAYEHEAARRSSRHSFPVEIMESSAFAWDRPERVAAFVSSHDPSVQILGSAVHAQLSSSLPEHARASSPLRNLLLGAAAFDALQAADISYKPDPARPFSGVALGQAAVDSVQFPGLTLQRKTGDCDDLSVLYASLLENLNVPSALCIVPGHVFVLLDTGVLEANRQVFAGMESQIMLRDGRIWIPVEVTRLGPSGSDFSGAWAAGALRLAQNRDAASKTTVEVRHAWLDNPPATFAAPAVPAVPDLSQARAETGALALRIAERALGQAAAGEDAGALLARGKALLRTGMFEPAEKAFEKALSQRESYEAVFGLAAARAGRGELLPAILGFEKALGLSADALQKFQCHMAMAQCYRQDGNIAKARRHLEQATQLNPAARTDPRSRGLMSFLTPASEAKAAAEK
jgi:transglutaminase-like putative cysteine protease